MAEKNSEAVLRAEIQQDAARQAGRILERAKAEAETTLARARAEAQSEADRILEEARRRAASRGDMILRSVDQEVERQTLQAREQILQQVLDQAAAALKQLPPEAYRKAVAQLAAEAISRMFATEFTVRISAPPEYRLEAHAVEGEIAALLRQKNKTATVHVQVQSGSPTGVVVQSNDGRLRWDNTFETRMQRLRPALRQAVASVLFEET